MKEPVVTWADEEKKIMGCKHYRRGCLVRAPCCPTFYSCRFCHNENEAKHEINRHAIHEIICMHCLVKDPKTAPQPVSNECVKCKAVMARYFCAICKFFDDEPDRAIFRCEGCGVLSRCGSQCSMRRSRLVS